LIHEARAYIERARIESEWIIEARDRSQLRANLRFWASFILNCTGSYPDTTLRPAHTYRSQLSGLHGISQANADTFDSAGRSSGDMNGAMDEPRISETEENSQLAGSEDIPDMPLARSAWYSQFSRLAGVAAILIVGVIPLAAVCLALSLFFSLDNQTHFVWTGNFATQTASVAPRQPVLTPVAPGNETPKPVLDPAGLSPETELPLVFARVSLYERSIERAGCTPELVLSLDVPATIDETPVQPAEVIVSKAGTDQVVANGRLEPGSVPLKLQLEEVEPSSESLAWLIQVEHPWLDVEALILTGSALDDCARNQVSIEYGSEASAQAWLAARDKASAGDLGLNWKLLTWGPDALEGQDWVAAVKLLASGGNGQYVYFAEGDLAIPTGAGKVNGLLPEDQMVLGQKSCHSGVARVGVTSAGQNLYRALAVQLVDPECR
jgi:hypothetical protein